MPVEFALRPRLRLREDNAGLHRARFRLPRFVLPVVGYWLAVTGVVYGLLHSRVSPRTLPTNDESAVTARAVLASAGTAPLRERSGEPVEVAPDRAREPPPTNAPSAQVAPPRALLIREVPDTDPGRPAPVLPDPPAPSGQELSASSTRTESPATRVPAVGSQRSTGALPGCEAALAAANQELDFTAGNNVADLPSQAIARVLDGPWLESCGVPDGTSVDVCVAIRGGSVVGVSVATLPENGAISGCIRRRAAALQFPYSPRLDIARTRF